MTRHFFLVKPCVCLQNEWLIDHKIPLKLASCFFIHWLVFFLAVSIVALHFSILFEIYEYRSKIPISVEARYKMAKEQKFLRTKYFIFAVGCNIKGHTKIYNWKSIAFNKLYQLPKITYSQTHTENSFSTKNKKLPLIRHQCFLISWFSLKEIRNIKEDKSKRFI